MSTTFWRGMGQGLLLIFALCCVVACGGGSDASVVLLPNGASSVVTSATTITASSVLTQAASTCTGTQIAEGVYVDRTSNDEGRAWAFFRRTGASTGEFYMLLNGSSVVYGSYNILADSMWATKMGYQASNTATALGSGVLSAKVCNQSKIIAGYFIPPAATTATTTVVATPTPVNFDLIYQKSQYEVPATKEMLAGSIGNYTTYQSTSYLTGSIWNMTFYYDGRVTGTDAESGCQIVQDSAKSFWKIGSDAARNIYYVQFTFEAIPTASTTVAITCAQDGVTYAGFAIPRFTNGTKSGIHIFGISTVAGVKSYVGI